MKMKKLVALYLVMAGLVLSACGKKADVPKPEETQVAEENTVEEEKADSGQEEEAEVEAEEVVQEEVPEETESEDTGEVRLLHLNKDYRSTTYMDMETYDYYLEYEDEKVVLTEEEAVNYPELAKALEDELNLRNKMYQPNIDSFLEDYNREKEFGHVSMYKVTSDVRIERADSLVLSIADAGGYSGFGAHGMYSTQGYNYDTKTGKPLKFSQVVSDPVAFLNLANEKIQNSFSGEFETPSNLDDYMENYNKSINWTIDYQGVRLYFSPYELGSFALGAIETKVYFNEAPELFNPKYLNIPESYVIELDSLEPSYIDINNDGENEKIIITSRRDEEYDYIIGKDINIDGKKVSFDGETSDFYFVCHKGKNYILATVSNEGGFFSISPIDLSTMSIDSENETEGFFAVISSNSNDEDGIYEENSVKAIFTDPDNVRLSTYIQFIGTMTGVGSYHMEEGARLVADTGVYNIDTNSVVTANMDIECEQVDYEGNFIGIVVIPKGTRLIVRRGDGKNFADLIEVPDDADISDYEYYVCLNSELEMKDADIIYRVYGEMNEDSYQVKINGQEEYKVFNNILYAD